MTTRSPALAQSTAYGSLAPHQKTFSTSQPTSANSIELLADNIMSAVINKSGMKRSLLGTQYLLQAVKSSLANRALLTNGVTKALYPWLGARFGKKPASIERAIRNALNDCYGAGSPSLNHYFQTSMFTPSRCPTNAEFITLLVDHILLEARNRL